MRGQLVSRDDQTLDDAPAERHAGIPRRDHETRASAVLDADLGPDPDTKRSKFSAQCVSAQDLRDRRGCPDR
jgi:hypothetical protein